MKEKDKAIELVEKYTSLKVSVLGCGKDKGNPCVIEDNICLKDAKQCAIIAVERNILMFTELVNKMDDFSNESREIIWQLIENEENVKKEIINKK